MMQQIRRMQQQEGGFTLIELLIVIVILGILAAIVVFAVGGITDRGTVSACKSDVKTVTVAVEAYFAQNGQYLPGNAATVLPQLVSAGFLHSVPAATAYTITYQVNPAAGTTPTSTTISATGLAGCP